MDIKMPDILSYLPERIRNSIGNAADIGDICEIRLRQNRPVSVTANGKNILCGVSCTKNELESVLSAMCGGSLHAHGETIRQGFISLPDGCRAGICGHAVTSKDEVTAVRDITSINLRIPRSVKNVGNLLCKYITDSGFSCGLLIYSPPGEGKTTLLRDIAATLSSPPYLYRIAVIDTRSEIWREDMFADSIADIFTAYPKAEAIEAATRTMSPQAIVCDEIGIAEADPIIAAQNTGVPLIASAHANSVVALLKRTAFKKLHESGVFGCYAGIKREGGGFTFELTKREDLKN